MNQPRSRHWLLPVPRAWERIVTDRNQTSLKRLLAFGKRSPFQSDHLDSRRLKAGTQKIHALPAASAPSGSEAGPQAITGENLPAVQRLFALLGQPVSGASLAVVRIAVGLVMMLEVHSLWHPSDMISGMIPLDTYYVGADIRFHFPLAGFGWLPFFPPGVMRLLTWVLAGAGLLMAVGLWYRLASIVVLLVWSYLFVIESTRNYYQSYYYIELLFVLLLPWMPAARRFSLDAWLARGNQAPRTVPFWTVFLLRGQLVIMYFYGGVAKLNADWLLDAVPLRWRLHEPHVTALFDAHLSPAHAAWVGGVFHSLATAYFLSWAGALFDLSIGFLLLVRRTRIFGLLLMLFFHAINHFVIYDNIDWYPLVGATTASIFLDPDWPERLENWLKRPRIARPDWKWFGIGGIVFPLVGAALGWRLNPTPLPNPPEDWSRPSRWCLGFIGAWLCWQALMPLRQYLIAGDARITYEGLSFSWRLKTDEHYARRAQLFVHDPALISDQAGRDNNVQWGAWHGDRAIYRRLNPGHIDWAALPEILAIAEPIVGERIIYNPLSAGKAVRTEREARDQVKTVWLATYGREPRRVGVASALSRALQSVAAGLQSGGQSTEARQMAALAAQARAIDQLQVPAPVSAQKREVIHDFLQDLQDRDPNGALAVCLASIFPFALEGEPPRGAPFLVIDDPLLFGTAGLEKFKLHPGAWKTPANTPRESNGGSPLVIYTPAAGPEELNDFLPKACLFDYQDYPGKPPMIWWNTLSDATVSKFDHISNHPFYLRRYARRVADLWETEYGRRPAVTAITGVSLNHRPYQPIVDPKADLASVPVAWFGHNAWVRDLEMARIPRANLALPQLD
jgi:vitamin K-dependent gamma-carboxylase